MTNMGSYLPWEIALSFNPAGGVGYGGGEFSAGKHGVAFAERNGRLYYAPYWLEPVRVLTPGFGSCASPALSPDESCVAFVHTYEDRDVLAIVGLDGTAWPKILSYGADFYMQPCWSPDGNSIAWVEWDHPNMPWDGARLMVAEFDPTNQVLRNVRHLDGSQEVATFQPAFSPDGRYLAYLRNRGEWDQLMVWDRESGEMRELVKDKSLLPPAWVQGLHNIAWTPESDALYFIENSEATSRVNKVELTSGNITPVHIGMFTHIEQLCVSERGILAFIGQSPSIDPQIFRMKRTSPRLVARNKEIVPDKNYYVDSHPVSWKSSDGAIVYGNYYMAQSYQYISKGLPPMIVHVHGGPTSQSIIGYSLERDFFLSRGYAFLEVNYRGSTGYGRSYREALRHNWGPLDLQDTVQGAQAMVDNELADPSRMVVMGGSAGGFTVLNALIHYPHFFKAGICSYGVSNLFTLAMETHKFEAYYNDFLVGELPDAAQEFPRMVPPSFMPTASATPSPFFKAQTTRWCRLTNPKASSSTSKPTACLMSTAYTQARGTASARLKP